MDTDVLVVGAGLVGLMMAGELRRLWCTVSYHRQASNAVTLLQGSWDPAADIRDLGTAWHRHRDDQRRHLAARHGGLREQARSQAHRDGPRRSPYGFLGLPQYDTERILTTHLARFGTSVERGVELRAFRQTDEGVTAMLEQSAGETETLRCHSLVGCDGAHSTVRHGLGLSFEGEQYPLELMLGDVQMHWALPHGYGYRFMHVVGHEADDFLICIPLPERHASYCRL
jgi:2-polyprenyl-6-methoxyphenol hydroxylase-like FAD-dependent oxidoreductase